jgi:hypothetical protein
MMSGRLEGRRERCGLITIDQEVDDLVSLIELVVTLRVRGQHADGQWQELGSTAG